MFKKLAFQQKFQLLPLKIKNLQSQQEILIMKIKKSHHKSQSLQNLKKLNQVNLQQMMQEKFYLKFLPKKLSKLKQRLKWIVKILTMNQKEKKKINLTQMMMKENK